MNLLEITQQCGGKLYGDNRDITRVSTDTRSIGLGDLFVALKGENFNGNEYLSEAELAGAAAVVAEQQDSSLRIPQVIVHDGLQALGKIAQLKRQSYKGKVVAVTGSSGKTTVKGMLKRICELAGKTAATKGNFNNFVGVPLTLLDADVGADFYIVEAGTNAKGEIGYLADLIQADVAVVNNVQEAHIGGFGSLEAIAEEKFAIYRGHSVCVVNADNALCVDKMNRALAERVICRFAQQKSTLGVVSGSDLWVENLRADKLGRFQFAMMIAGEPVDISLQVPGQHNVSNALCAAQCARNLGIDSQVIQQGLSIYPGDKGRMQFYSIANGGTLVDDSYNANPGSMKAAIDWLSLQEDSILVVGDMGELGENIEEYHRELGEYAAGKNIAQVFAVGEFASSVVRGFGGQAQAFQTQCALIQMLDKKITETSVLLIKGSRSSKMENVVSALLGEVPSQC